MCIAQHARSSQAAMQSHWLWFSGAPTAQQRLRHAPQHARAGVNRESAAALLGAGRAAARAPPDSGACGSPGGHHPHLVQGAEQAQRGPGHGGRVGGDQRLALRHPLPQGAARAQRDLPRACAACVPVNALRCGAAAAGPQGRGAAGGASARARSAGGGALTAGTAARNLIPNIAARRSSSCRTRCRRCRAR